MQFLKDHWKKGVVILVLGLYGYLLYLTNLGTVMAVLEILLFWALLDTGRLQSAYLILTNREDEIDEDDEVPQAGNQRRDTMGDNITNS